MAKEVLELEVKSNVGTVTKDVEGLGKATDTAKGGFKGLGTAVKGVGMALKAAGIGLIVAAFMALKEALERNQKVMNVINSVMSTVSTTFNQVVDVLVDTYEWVTKSSERFDGLGKVLSGLMTLALTPLKVSFYSIKLAVESLMLAWEKSPLGGGDTEKIANLTASIEETKSSIDEVAKSALNAGKDIVANFGDAIGEIGALGEKVIDGVSKISVKANFEQAKATEAAKNSAKLAEAQIQGLIEKNDKLAETQRQIRDDETKTFADRIAANEELGRILDQQEVDMLKLADTRVSAAAFELAQNKENIDLQVAYQQALNDRAGVEAQIAGFRSEQMTNEVSLNKELLETQKELRASALEGMELELQELKDGYDAKVELARKANVSITDITAQYEKEQTAIKKKFAKEQIDLDKLVEDAKVNTIQMGFNVAGSLAKEGSAAAKGIAVAQTIFNTQQAIMKAMAEVPPPYNVVQSALTGVMGATAIAKILSTDPSGGGGGGAAAAAPGPAAPAPQMMSGAFELGGGIEPEATRAYVVTDEMTSSQNQLANIRRRATI